MACANISWPEENFVCSICLDVFNSPVSIPCGHNFCRTCIEMYWDKQTQSKCPVCNRHFLQRPDLQVNYLLSAMAAQIRTGAPENKQPCVKLPAVPCDVCTGTQLRAAKSCLVCLVSYCHAHLEPHQRVAGLKRHKLVNPAYGLQDHMCKQHDWPLEFFCQTEQVCVCQFCTEGDHKHHPFVPLEECEAHTAELKQIESEAKQTIQERRRTRLQIQDAVKCSIEEAEREMADGAQVLHSLMLYVESYRDDFNQMVKHKLESTGKQAEDHIKELDLEIEDLNHRCSEVKRLSHIDDPLQLLQAFRSLKSRPSRTTDLTMMGVRPQRFLGSLRKSLDQLKEPLNVEMEKLCDAAELKRAQEYEVHVTLDPETAHPKLVVSEDGKQVHDGGVRKDLPDNPKRFTHNLYVLTKQSFSSGRFYFEVQVRGKNAWCLGLAGESSSRKGGVAFLPENGYWTVDCNKDQLQFKGKPAVCLPARAELRKVGVFVDYDEGRVSFYDVDARGHVYSGSGFSFTEPLFPALCPCLRDGGTNLAPMIISPVHR